ncbi:BatD family protein [Aliivibrio fischeri]|uniref:BatD family protein n=1 Tax=Aliivibrio fischeri TaxID=668 RepID=UPI0012DA6E0C|nr:BatD family protein [Aliivibrio fischeri]MUJ23635.1 hypothetical protein [Aliivibrio fischeri]
MSRHNDKRRLIHLLVFMIVLLITVSFSARSNAANKLESADNVSIKTWLSEPSKTDEEQKAYAINQQIILYIEVVTPRWFTGGTRIAAIDIPNVAVKQRNQLATNFTERKEGVTWTHQRWEVTLYPQKAGTYVIPPTAVKVQVSKEGVGNVSGTIYTQAQTFKVIKPSGLLDDKQQWVSGLDFTVQQKWDTSNSELEAGDSITRTITIKGADTLAMLIPEILPATSSTHYQTYNQPPKLSDTQTRGDYLSQREESSVYVLQTGGEVTFPALELVWWDVDSGELKTINIEGQTFAVSHTLRSWFIEYWKPFAVCVFILLLIIVAAIKTVRYYQTHPLPAWLVYSRAVNQEEWGTVRMLLYRLLRETDHLVELKAYESKQEWQSEATQFQNKEVTTSLSKRLWKVINRRDTAKYQLGERIKLKKALPQLNKYRINKKKK